MGINPTEISDIADQIESLAARLEVQSGQATDTPTTEALLAVDHRLAEAKSLLDELL